MPQSARHSAKGGTRQKPSLPSATLGKKNGTWRPSPPTPSKFKKKIFCRVPALALGKEVICRVLGNGTRQRRDLYRVQGLGTRQRPSLPSARAGTRQIFCFFCFFAPLFFAALIYYLKLHVQIWHNFDFFSIFRLFFFCFVEFYGIFQIWTAGAWNNRIWSFKK